MITPFNLSTAPDIIPIFPLDGALLLPGGELPLNIFEPRYLAMVTDVMATPTRVLGMVQPKGFQDSDDIYRIGCIGRINSFHETDDGRFLITLTGMARFRVLAEETQIKGYRRVRAGYSDFVGDLTRAKEEGSHLDRMRLMVLLKEYFKAEGLMCNWDNVKNADDDTLITALAMVCPFDNPEKQALLEANDPKDRAHIFLTLLEMAVAENRSDNGTDMSPPTWQ